MNTCKPHWDAMREAVKAHGMGALVAKSGEEAHERVVKELRIGGDDQNFDPLMSMHWHFSQISLSAFGLSMMVQKDDGSMPCHLCELHTHYTEFEPKEQIEKTCELIFEYCTTHGLITKN